MGVVFKAVDTALDKVVALKALDPVHAQSEQFLGRFRIEARTLGRLQHPHIVNVFAFRHVEPHLFIVMEYVDGGSVADLIAERGAVPWKEALPIIRQSLQATVFAHRANVVHRDIKPRNILLTRSGAVKVTDFGLAKIQEATGEGHGLTRTGITGGTLYYMPPEQLEGLNRVDHRGDIYSLGMSCYELLAGRVPFDKQQSEFSILKAIDAHSFPPLYTFAPDVPRPLAEIVTKALEYDPADRFQSANAMLEALDAWTAGDEKTVLAPADDATQVFGWAAPPPTPSDVRSSEEALAGDESTPGKNAPGAERQEENRGDSSSLLKSLKLLLKDRSGNWRVSGAPAGEGEAEPLDSGEQVDPALQATAIASAPLKVSKPLAEESRRPRTERPRKRARARATPPETASAPRRRPHPLLLAAGVAALLAVAFLLYPAGEGEEAGAPAALSIRTDPGGASVSLGGQSIGTTPLLNLEA
jgi:serine/threonine protein kinase